MWFWVITSCIALFFFAWLGVSLYFRIIAPSKVFETDKSHIKLHIKRETDFATNKSGEKIEIVTVPKKNSKETIIYFHGSLGRLTNILVGAREVGTGVSPAFPGYAGSEGKPSATKIYETVDLTMKYLAEK